MTLIALQCHEKKYILHTWRINEIEYKIYDSHIKGFCLHLHPQTNK